LHTYNLSIEELPFYLADEFGLEQMINILKVIEKENSSEQVRESIHVFRYWLNIK
jgi:hypothetical protein